MRGPAERFPRGGKSILLAVAALIVPFGTVAAAADRFVPVNPGFVVANITQSAPDESLRALLAR